MNLDKWRQQIDQIDERLLEVLSERAALVLQIGREKRAQGVPVLDSEREAQILQRLCARNRGPFSDQAIRRIFSQIFEESQRLQEKILP